MKQLNIIVAAASILLYQMCYCYYTTKTILKQHFIFVWFEQSSILLFCINILKYGSQVQAACLWSWETSNNNAKSVYFPGVIGELTAAKTQKEAQIQKLTDELSDVSRNLKLLQDEKNLLLSKSTNDAHQKSLEVQALEQV